MNNPDPYHTMHNLDMHEMHPNDANNAYLEVANDDTPKFTKKQVEWLKSVCPTNLRIRDAKAIASSAESLYEQWLFAQGMAYVVDVVESAYISKKSKR